MAKSILIVDDNTDTLNILSRLLQKEGYSLTTAEDGAGCMKELEQSKPDLILLDVMLPDTLGTDLCLKIKDDPKYHDIIIILLSGHKISEEDHLMGFEIGAIDYINRPLSNKELIAKVNAIFRLKHALVNPREDEPFSSLTQNHTDVTAGVFEQINIWETHPELFNRFKNEYLKIMEKQIEHRIYKSTNNLSDQIRALSHEFGFLKAGPKEVIAVHKEALKSMVQDSSAIKSYYVKEESRILLLELMGYLLMYYRNRNY